MTFFFLPFNIYTLKHIWKQLNACYTEDWVFKLSEAIFTPLSVQLQGSLLNKDCKSLDFLYYFCVVRIPKGAMYRKERFILTDSFGDFRPYYLILVIPSLW